MALEKAPEQYSTNPSTIKARRRKMNLNGAKKVEDAARTADYKAMIYARKVVQARSEFVTASDVDKAAMLETAMRETMEKRRVKGQDTMSKMAAYNAGLYRQRTGTTGPQTRVPIADFLQNNGYVPVSASRASEGHNRGTTAELASILTPCPTNNHLNKGNVANPAPFADMTGDGSTSLPSSHDMNSVSSQSAAPCFPPIGRQISDSDGRPPAPSTQLKASNTPPSFANMTPDRSILPSIEGDGNGEVAALRKDVFQLRSVCHGALASNNSVRRHAHELEEDRSEVEGDQNGVINLGQRLSQLEGIIHAMQYTSMTTVVDRVVQLERAVDELKGKVGDGCEAEVAKMREVFGSLRESLVRVGSFL